MTNLDQEVARCMALPYRIELIPDPHGWFVRMPELPGCMSQGDTQEEALVMIRDAQQLWLRGALEDGWAIPEPRSEDEFSGKFNVRVPRYVHRDLVRDAREQGVSLNLLVATALARATARPHLAGAERPDHAVAANGREPQVAADTAGILERLGALYEQLLHANDYVARGAELEGAKAAEMAHLLLDYKAVTAHAGALIANGSIDPTWLDAALNDVREQRAKLLAQV